MKSTYSIYQKIVAYFMTLLLVFHLFSGNIGYVRAEGDTDTADIVSIEASVENGGAPQKEVAITYKATNVKDGETAYRKIIFQNKDGDSEVVKEGEIPLLAEEGYQMTETYSGIVETDSEGVWMIDDGTYKVTYFLKDAAGVEISNVACYTFSIDSVAPQVEFNMNNPAVMNSGQVVCNARVSDVDFDQCTLNIMIQKTLVDGTVEQTTLTNEDFLDAPFMNGVEKQVTFTEEGKYQIYMEASDRAGNVGKSEDVEFIIDSSQPDIAFYTGGKVENGGLCNIKEDGLEVSLQVADFGVIDDALEVKVKKDNGWFENKECQWNTNGYMRTADIFYGEDTEDGTYTIQVNAWDIFGRQSTETFVFTVDNTVIAIGDLGISYENTIFENPNAVIQEGKTVYYAKGDIRISANVIEKNYTGSYVYMDTEKDGMTIENKEEALAAENQEICSSFDEEGCYITNVYGKDSFGNTSEKQSIHYVIDKTAPQMCIKGVMDGVEQNIEKNQLFSVGENRTLRFLVKETYHNKKDYRIRIEHRTSFFVNPTVTVLDASSIAWQDGSEQGLIYYENQELFQEEGQYKVTIEGEDLAGNQAVTQEVNFYIDASAPEIEQRSAIKNGGIYDEAVKFQYVIKELNFNDVTAQITVQRTFDGEITTVTKPLQVDSAEALFEYDCKEQGQYNITVNAVDKAGNEATQANGIKGYKIQFVVDMDAPNLAITGVTNGFMTKNPVLLNFETKDRNHNFERYRIRIHCTNADGEVEDVIVKGTELSAYDTGNGWSATGSTTAGQSIHVSNRSLQLSQEGNYEVTFTGIDKAGNESKGQSVKFSIDKTAPVISDITYSNSNGLLTERYHNIYSNKAILMEFTVEDKVVGVDDSKVYVTVGESVEKNADTKLYVAHKSLGSRYYVYIPTDLQVSEFDDKVTIWANDKLANESCLASANIVYQTAKPTIKMNCDVDYSKWTNKSVKFHTTVTDNVAGLKEIVYKVNGKTVKKVSFKELTYTYNYDVVASESAEKVTGYPVTVEVTNNSGTVRTEKRQVYIDKVKPRVSLSGLKNGTHYQENKVFTTDIEDVSYKDTKTIFYITRVLDGTTTRVSASSFQSKGYKDSCTRKMTREGAYKVYAVTEDGAGNHSKSNTLSFVIDKTAPVVSISGVTEGTMSKEAVTLQLECTESFYTTNTVDVKIEKELDGVGSYSELTQFPKSGKRSITEYTFEEDGTYHVTISAVDKAGNVAKSQSMTFSIDATQPEISITGTNNYQLWAGPTTVTFTVEESYYSGNNVSITGTRKDIDGNVENIALPQFVTENKVSSLKQLFSQDGIYELLVVAKDEAGNESSKSIHFTIDQTMPEIRGVLDYNGGYYQYFRMADNLSEVFKDLTVVSYRLLLNGVDYNGTDTVETEGKYNLSVEVEDELGHKNMQDVEFIIDHTPPKVIFTGVKNGAVVDEEGVISMTLVDAEDEIIAIRMNGKEYGPDIKELRYTEYGNYNIEVDCCDKAGNSATHKLHFVYSNPLLITFAYIGAGVLIVGICIWIWMRFRKREEEESIS